MTRGRRMRNTVSGVASNHRPGNERSQELARLATTVAASGANLLAPPSGVALTVLSFGLGILNRQRAKREKTLIRDAARVADVSPRRLLRLLKSDPAKQELLLHVLRLAGTTTRRQKLVASAFALGVGATADDEGVQWGLDFGSAVDAMDDRHLELLLRFTYSWDQLGVTPGPKWEGDPPIRMASAHIRQMASDLPNLPALLATVQSLGLVESDTWGQSTLGGGGPTSSWRITRFGEEFISTIQFIDALLKDAVAS